MSSKKQFTGIFLAIILTWTIFASGLIWQYNSTQLKPESTPLTMLSLSIIAAWVVFSLAVRYFSAWRDPLMDMLGKATIKIDAIPAGKIFFYIALSAALGLYAELMIIRVQSSFFQIFAYFKNVTLISCFLGLGIGYTKAAKRPLFLPLMLPAMVIQTIVMFVLKSHYGITELLHIPVSEQLAFGVGVAKNIHHLVASYGFISFFFITTAVIFIPLGQIAGYFMKKTNNLSAYAWNLAGSLVGIIVFSLISYLSLPPVLWFILLTVCLLLFFRDDIPSGSLTAFSALAVVFILSLPVKINQLEVYSPYQPVTLIIEKDSPPALRVSNIYYQRILDLREDHLTTDALKAWENYYSLPYKIKPSPSQVLIVGSGTGNDVAAAIRNSAGHVDAVEIDPVIMRFGKLLHPESPYQSEKVTPVVNDARAFMKNTKNKYDLIVFGLLDSHTLLATNSSVRLDSYVYTVESFRRARELLKDNGVLSLSFSILDQVMAIKIFSMLQEAFDGRAPQVIMTEYDAGFTYLAWNRPERFQIPRLPGIKDISQITALVLKAGNVKVTNSTDDWPFFYMPEKKFPVQYLNMVIVLVLIAAYLLITLKGKGKFSFNVPCFFLGAGFMLIETKAITELALLYGSTWIVISFVVGAILLMAYLANLIVIKRGAPSPKSTYLLLITSILAGYVFAKTGPHNNIPLALNQLIATVILTIPVFFSGFAFSSEIRKPVGIDSALFSNLMGAILGGFLEYTSMYTGFSALYLLAAFIYFMAFMYTKRSAA